MNSLFYIAQFISGNKLPQPGTGKTLQTVFSLFFVTLGAFAVLLFVIAGLRYVVSQGDPTKIAESKMRLVHIGIGLAIAALASAIVSFVIGRVG